MAKWDSSYSKIGFGEEKGVITYRGIHIPNVFRVVVDVMKVRPEHDIVISRFGGDVSRTLNIIASDISRKRNRRVFI